MAPTAPSKASIVIVGSLDMDILTLLFEYWPPQVGAPFEDMMHWFQTLRWIKPLVWFGVVEEDRSPSRRAT